MGIGEGIIPSTNEGGDFGHGGAEKFLQGKQEGRKWAHVKVVLLP
jgi:hypothetical protein